MRSARRFFSEELLLSASVLFLPVVYMTAALALLSDVGLGLWVFPTGLLLWGTAVVALHREEGWQRLAATLLLFLAAFALAAWATSHTLDMFFDSRQYHAPSVRNIVNGFNPYLHTQIWHYTYPAAHWLLSASLILWTQSFEANFAFTLVASFVAFLCARRFLFLLEISRPWRFWLSALFVANPFTMLRIFSFYNDGLLVSTLLSVFLLMLCFVRDKGSGKQDRRRRLRTAFGIVALFVVLVNLKHGARLRRCLGADGALTGSARRKSKAVCTTGRLGSLLFFSRRRCFWFLSLCRQTMRHNFTTQIHLHCLTNRTIRRLCDRPSSVAVRREDAFVGKTKRGERGVIHEPLPPSYTRRAKTAPMPKATALQKKRIVRNPIPESCFYLEKEGASRSVVHRSAKHQRTKYTATLCLFRTFFPQG